MDVKGGGDMSGHIFMQGLDSSRTRYAVPNDSKTRKRKSPGPAHAPIMIPRTFPRVGWGGAGDGKWKNICSKDMENGEFEEFPKRAETKYHCCRTKATRTKQKNNGWN